jgi:hypothetical protein
MHFNNKQSNSNINAYDYTDNVKLDHHNLIRSNKNDK